MFAPPTPGVETLQDPIRLSDWVELNLLLEEEQTVSATDVTGEIADAPPDDSDDSERRFSGGNQHDVGYWESAENLAEGTFVELAKRTAWLRDKYPLSIKGDVATLNGESDRLDVYRFLISLRARHLYPSALGDDGEDSGLIFEELAKHAVGVYIGTEKRNRVRFGVAGGHRGDGLPDDVSEAVRDLRQRMHEAPGHVPANARGDYQADVITWKPFEDERPGQLVVIGQATITEGDWLRKEPAPRWTTKEPAEERLIDFLARPVTAVAFAETLSLTPRDRLKGLTATFSSIPFDRLRILSVLCDGDLPAELRTQMNEWVGEFRDRLRR